MYKKFVKRILDFVMALVASVVLLPVHLIIMTAIKLDSRGPAIFLQNRIGRYKKQFPILKYRTMRTDTPHDVPTHQLREPDAYITKVGRFLRRTSLDELPQIVNILLGQMSIVGPRPALWNQDDLIAERDKYGANDIRPGLTGWAQVNGRDELEIPVKAKMDGDYVRQMSFVWDAKCFFLTFLKILRHEGIIEGDTGTMKKQG